MSQQFIRSINNGELLITDDGNDKSTITKLLFNFEQWSSNSQLQPQYQQFSVWLKKHLIQGHPCIIAAYTNDADNDPDYDHIMPAIGISYYEPTSSYNPKDKLLFYNLYQLKILERELSTNDMIKQRQTCNKSTLQGGCLPYNVDYGYAIFGIIDKQNVTLPLRLKVDRSDEPNLSLGASPVEMQGTITVFNLVLGRNYVLLRYKSYTEVPSSGNATAFQSSRYYKRHNFRAINVIYTYVDPEKILSNDTTYYRCVPAL
ncbi:unnamed protein product [Rotaria socialis]|uniref:Uncharacterized protein n=2 Tax=Rotaria socialis TaxID=392032 RepID=A0A818E0R1_9BILA|nr:unnamed protein product [Rotaria socialis]CAF4348901.1 unnamed protein product [Rotaria socialis]